MKYSAPDNLEVMEEAVVYNNYLLAALQNSFMPTDEIILDFGAGTGFYAEQVQLNNPQKQIIALEPAENLDVFYQTKHIRKISSLENCSSLDVIYSFNVLEHIKEDETALGEIFDKLKTGGRLVLYVPAIPYLYSSMDKKVGHYRRYTRDELIAKAEAAGFYVETCKYVDFIGCFASLIYKWFGSKNGDINPKMLRIYDRYVMPFSIWLDKLTQGKFLGKNLWLEAVK